VGIRPYILRHCSLHLTFSSHRTTRCRDGRAAERKPSTAQPLRSKFPSLFIMALLHVPTDSIQSSAYGSKAGAIPTISVFTAQIASIHPKSFSVNKLFSSQPGRPSARLRVIRPRSSIPVMRAPDERRNIPFHPTQLSLSFVHYSSVGEGLGAHPCVFKGAGFPPM